MNNKIDANMPTNEQLEAVHGKMPEPPEGYKWKLVRGLEKVKPGVRCIQAGASNDYLWSNSFYHTDAPRSMTMRTMKAVPIAKPTTLEDLVGEDGQKVVWIHVDEEYKAQALVTVGEDDLFDFFVAGESHSIEKLDRAGARWSHNLTKSFADAQPFVVGGDNE